MSPSHTSLKLEVEILHKVDINVSGSSIKIAKEPITANNKRLALDNANCSDMGAPIKISGKNLMKKMGLTVKNLHKDKMLCCGGEHHQSAALHPTQTQGEAPGWQDS